MESVLPTNLFFKAFFSSWKFCLAHNTPHLRTKLFPPLFRSCAIYRFLRPISSSLFSPRVLSGWMRSFNLTRSPNSTQSRSPNAYSITTAIELLCSTSMRSQRPNACDYNSHPSEGITRSPRVPRYLFHRVMHLKNSGHSAYLCPDFYALLPRSLSSCTFNFGDVSGIQDRADGSPFPNAR